MYGQNFTGAAGGGGNQAGGIPMGMGRMAMPGSQPQGMPAAMQTGMGPTPAGSGMMGGMGGMGSPMGGMGSMGGMGAGMGGGMGGGMGMGAQMPLQQQMTGSASPALSSTGRLTPAQTGTSQRSTPVPGASPSMGGLASQALRDTISPALLGLSLSYALQVTGTLNWCIRQFTETEVAMNAVERVHYYGSSVPQEAAPVLEHSRPPKDWPQKGTLVVQNLSMRYSETTPLVLKDVSFALGDAEKVGIVGRTGSGKSSIMNALFRMVEPESGSKIEIDGVDAMSIGVRDLRGGLSIIPQDPVLFSGTVRTNLDPFGEFDDAAVWDALGRANLREK
ncbi:Multidrug resistance-associated protein 5, partial [Quaeritorhiza haematococci]